MPQIKLISVITSEDSAVDKSSSSCWYAFCYCYQEAVRRVKHYFVPALTLKHLMLKGSLVWSVTLYFATHLTGLTGFARPSVRLVRMGT